MLKRLWARIHSYFYYNRMERNGIIALVVLLTIFFVGLFIYERMRTPALQTNRFFKQVDSIEQALRVPEIKPTYFAFNPNEVDSVTLRKLGFSEKQTKNILNYRKAGGRFYKKQDFQKLYFVTDSIFQIYEAYLVIPERKKPNFQRKKTYSKKEKVVVKKKDTLFYFNPNTMTIAEWQKLGVSKKVAQTVKNYLAKGGHFKKAEDLKIIYGLSAATYSRLQPYIQIPKEKKKEEVVVIYDLNAITVNELEGLKIRPKIAQRIMKFRDLLGGYAQLQQLDDVYGIRKFELGILRKHCKIQSQVKQIDINEASLQELKKHPYINYVAARAIVRYRKRNGKFTTEETLKKSKILSDKVFEKAKSYLKIKN